MIATAPPAPIPSFALSRPAAAPTLGFTAALPVESLTERHRPATLAGLVGQGAAVYQLETFLEAPAPKAFLFAGPTGVGKTTAARALAHDLGVDPDWGLTVLRSAEADGQAVDDALRMLRHTCPTGSGWRLCIVDEADLMSPKAAHLWLSALEDLPPRSVVVFTTNQPEKFPDRFLDRTERIDFAANGDLLWQDGEILVERIWLAETGRTDAPRLTTIPGVVDAKGRISFRRVVAALDPMIRRLAASKPGAARPAAPPAPVASKPPARPAIASAPRPAPTPAPVGSRPAAVKLAPPSVAGTTDAERIKCRLVELEREYERIGDTLLAMDLERDALKAERKRLARRK